MAASMLQMRCFRWVAFVCYAFPAFPSRLHRAPVRCACRLTGGDMRSVICTNGWLKYTPSQTHAHP